MSGELKRSLGLLSSVNIGVGTMIGAGIFVLAGTSYEITGPSAALAIFLSGCAAVLTALSFAELATVIPASGGGYSYMKKALGRGLPAFLCGWGFWLGYSMAVGLFVLGFGKFIHFFLPPVSQAAAALLLLIYVVWANIKSVGEAGRLQNGATLVMLLLLLVFAGYGGYHIRAENFSPFITSGLPGLLQATALLYMTYIGYGLLAHLGEEVVDADRTIPKAILISLAVATVIKTTVFLVGSGILPRALLLPSVTDTPLLDAARHIAGPFGAVLFAITGVLAMITSVNTSVLAASRTSYALSRDLLLPPSLGYIHPRHRTPVFSVILTGLFAVVCVLVNDYRYITAVSSICFLVGYSQVNVAVILLRKKMPDAKRGYSVPLFPYLPLAGIAVNMVLLYKLIRSDTVAAVMSFVLMGAGCAYFYGMVPAYKRKAWKNTYR